MLSCSLVELFLLETKGMQLLTPVGNSYAIRKKALMSLQVALQALPIISKCQWWIKMIDGYDFSGPNYALFK